MLGTGANCEACGSVSFLQQPWQLVVKGPAKLHGLPASQVAGGTYLLQNQAARDAGWTVDISMHAAHWTGHVWQTAGLVWCDCYCSMDQPADGQRHGQRGCSVLVSSHHEPQSEHSRDNCSPSVPATFWIWGLTQSSRTPQSIEQLKLSTLEVHVDIIRTTM